MWQWIKHGATLAPGNEKLTAEREAYDRGTLVRGVATIGGAVVAFIALIVILRAVL